MYSVDYHSAFPRSPLYRVPHCASVFHEVIEQPFGRPGSSRRYPEKHQ